MSEPFLAEIRIVGFTFAPRGWALCDGQILPINQHQSLYSLLGTTYGGDGRVSFALPDLRGRAPMHVDTGHNQGQKAGYERVTLTEAQMGQHAHGDAVFSEVTVNAASAVADQKSPVGNSLAAADPADARLEEKGYSTEVPDTPMAHDAIGLPSVGGGQAHENMPPFLTLNFCIALQGLFPSRS